MNRTRLLPLFVLLLSTVSFAQVQPIQVGDILAGTCDSWTYDTELGATEVMTSTGALINEFDANPGMNVCTAEMVTAADGTTYVRTDHAGVFAFDILGNKVGGFPVKQPLPGQTDSNGGALANLYSFLHDQRGNFYYTDSSGYLERAAGPDGDAGYQLPNGGGKRLDLMPDQRTVAYVGMNDANVYSYSMDTGVSALLVSGNKTVTVVALPDSSVLALDTSGMVTRWLNGSPQHTYTLPLPATNIAADPDGSSFRALYTFYDVPNQQGYGYVYKVSVASGALLLTSDISPGVSDGRYYSGSLQIYGSGLDTGAKTPPLVRYGNAKRPVPINTVKVKALGVKNTGSVVMVISNVGLRSDTGEFQLVKSTCNKGVTPGTHCNLWVQYLPTSAGQSSATVTVFANIPGANQQISLLGTAK